MGGALTDALRASRITGGIVILLVAVYVVEVVVFLAAGPTAVSTTFLATPEPSPGWVLAPFAHSLADPLHLLTSVVVVGVYGVLVEYRLPVAAYLRLYLLGGYAATAGQIASYALVPGPGTLGASGAALALVAFVTVTTAMRLAADEPTTLGERVFATTGVAILVLRFGRDLGVVVPAATGTAPVAHATGVLVGAVYGVWRAGLADRGRPGDRE